MVNTCPRPKTLKIYFNWDIEERARLTRFIPKMFTIGGGYFGGKYKRPGKPVDESY
jgi:hypothetical protein